MVVHLCFVGLRTDSESKEEEERDGMRAETPAKLTFWILHCFLGGLLIYKPVKRLTYLYPQLPGNDGIGLRGK